ncbi:MAG: TetR/AcrR family transcriptional regulator [Longimicrobiales bacterium]
MSDGNTRQKLLQAGLELMLSQGYSATAIDQVCSSAGVSKGSFYHFFSTKEEFGLAVLDAFYQRGVARVEEGEYTEVADSRQRLLAFFDHMEEIAPELWRHGCLLGSFASELADSSPPIRARVGELFDGLEEKLLPVFLGVAGDREEARDLANEMLALLEGTIVIARAHGEPDRIGEAVRRFRRSVVARNPELEGVALE